MSSSSDHSTDLPDPSHSTGKSSVHQESELRGLIDNNPDIIARFDSELRHVFINRAIEEAAALSPQHFIGKTVAEAGLPAEVSQVFDANLRQVFATGQMVAFEFRVPSPTGPRDSFVRLIPEMAADDPTRVATVLSVARDMTAFKLADQALRDSESRFQAFMDHSPAVAYLKDEDGRYIYLNERFRQRFPEAQERWFGKTIWDVAPPELAERVQRNDQEVLNFGGNVSSTEKYPQIDGKESYWQSYKFLVEGENGKRFVGGISLEVTAQKRAEADREKLLVELQEANKRLVMLNAEKNAFLGICTHDLKNPLSGIIGLAGLMKDGASDPAEAADYAKDILESAEFMFALVNNLLNVAAIEEDRFPLEPDMLNLRSLAAHVLGRYREAAAKKEISVAGVDLPANEAESAKFAIHADRNATLQVLDNLISNAIKYTPLGGRVEVRVAAEPKNQRVTVAISDNGPGLRPEEQAKLFQKFTRLSTRPTGGEHSTGLGLSIVKRLMTAMGGDVRCESQPGQGTTFFAQFPMGNSRCARRMRI